jgi:hexosaminidase
LETFSQLVVFDFDTDSYVRPAATAVFSTITVFQTDTSNCCTNHASDRSACVSQTIPHAPWTITDTPRFPHRGLMVDSARHFEPIETIKRMIDSLTYAKLNVLVSAQAICGRL